MESPKIIWLKDGRTYRQTTNAIELIESLPAKIYTVQESMNGLYLEEFADKFEFGFKVYGMETQLIDHIMKTIENTNSNLGVLFNGAKGTGKTVTAKIIASKTGLPVILVNAAYSGISDFISKINSPCVLLFDEYEKNFKADRGAGSTLLTIMDGVLNGPHRRIFLLTTNNLFIDDNLLGRPSRIRYKKTFGNLQPAVIKEYLDDHLNNKEYAHEILEFMDSLEISTIDILKSIVEELNLHDLPISQWKSFFNVESAKYTWRCMAKNVEYNKMNEDGTPYSANDFLKDLNSIGTRVVPDGDEDRAYVIDRYDVNIDPRNISTSSPVECLQVGEEFGGLGTITEPLNENGILVTQYPDGDKAFIKVMNVNSKPSLYRGYLRELY